MSELPPERATKTVIGIKGWDQIRELMADNENGVLFGAAPDCNPPVILVTSGPTMSLTVEEGEKLYASLGRVLEMAKKYRDANK